MSLLRRLLPYTFPVRIALGAMFVYAAAPKLANLRGSVLDVQAYNILPDPLAVVFGYAMPFVELAVGLLLALGLFTRLAALGGAALMVSFIVAIAVNLARGDHPECGCFSVGGEGVSPIDWTTLVRDLVLLAALGLPILDRSRLFSLDRWVAVPPGEEGGPAGAPGA